MTIKRREFLLGGLAGIGGLASGFAQAGTVGGTDGWGRTLGAGMTASVPAGRTPMSGLVPKPAANPTVAETATASLSVYNIHTTESLKVTYREEGALVTGALDEINHMLRDFRTGECIPIDVDLLDTLTLLYDHFGRRGHYELISGYRSPRTNAALRHVTTGVAKNSLHMDGRAADVRLVGTPTDKLRDAALALARGGVGYYPDSNFVHVDTGAVRSW